MTKQILALLTVLVLSFTAKAQLVISEIMFNPPESGTDSLEFIEIYNAGANTVNLRNHSIFYGGAKRLTFATDTNLLSNRLMVIAIGNPNAVRRQYNMSYTPIQVTSVSGLSNTGTALKILGTADETLDSVSYNSSWNAAAGGNGASLILCDPSSDNAVSTNWSASTMALGTIINSIELKASPGVLEACSGTLPVQWLSVNASIINKNETSISWKVQEYNVSSYIIEHSKDGAIFKPIATVDAKGSGLHAYAYTVSDVSNSFYRIKQTDIDGKYSYSRVITIKFNDKVQVQVSPNPVSNVLLVSIHPTLLQEQFTLVNSEGIVLQSVKPSSTNFQINMAAYPTGIYYLRATNGTLRIVKL
ncbi:MAG TPA: hypothetical protein DCQ29_11340 [Chitinophagaceae bacterium]|nr:hypothetical protein [Chitinophagaceae bacterium]